MALREVRKEGRAQILELKSWRGVQSVTEVDMTLAGQCRTCVRKTCSAWSTDPKATREDMGRVLRLHPVAVVVTCLCPY